MSDDVGGSTEDEGEDGGEGGESAACGGDINSHNILRGGI